MRERPRGTVARATAVAEGVATVMRRRARDREPRVLLYRRPGDPRVLAPGAKGHDRVLDVAEEMVALAVHTEPSTRRERRAQRRDDARGDEL
ncbi:MAG: hypothetical protein ACR2HC_05055 [Thermoleophilaceae bacterium]